MERTISQEERIRRAEEIYSRRRDSNRSGIRVSTNNVNTTKSKLSLLKKMALQLAICAVIYIIFYLIKNTNYMFSDNIINRAKEMLSYDINFGNVYAQVNSFIEDNKNKFNMPIEFENQNQEASNANIEQEKDGQNVLNETNEEANTQTNITQEGGIGGAEVNEIQETSSDEETKKSQMEIDAEYVKKEYSFKIPLKGTITSRFGEREATEVISAHHQGIDIGANKGTAIYAAMEGTVSLVSSEGDYGKHVEIKNGEVLTRYAHCNKIVVKEGAKIKQGQKIAEVGETGRATGPHLHFEIIRSGRVINPEYVLKF